MYQTFLDYDPEDSSDIDDATGTDDGGNDNESEVSRLVRLLESLGNIQNLSLVFQSRYPMILRTEGVAVPVTLRSLLPKMKKLTLKMQPYNTFTVSIVSCLLNTCPKLEDLVIDDTYGNAYRYPEASVLDYWDQQMPSDCMRNTLSTITVYLEDVCFWQYWIKVVKFLLNNACVLKNLVIDCYHQEKEQSKLEDLQRKLLLLRPTSPVAVVELKTARHRELHHV